MTIKGAISGKEGAKSPLGGLAPSGPSALGMDRSGRVSPTCGGSSPGRASRPPRRSRRCGRGRSSSPPAPSRGEWRAGLGPVAQPLESEAGIHDIVEPFSPCESPFLLQMPGPLLGGKAVRPGDPSRLVLDLLVRDRDAGLVACRQDDGAIDERLELRDAVPGEAPGLQLVASDRRPAHLRVDRVVPGAARRVPCDRRGLPAPRKPQRGGPGLAGALRRPHQAVHLVLQ